MTPRCHPHLAGRITRRRHLTPALPAGHQPQPPRPSTRTCPRRG